jgi:uncharacterized membrane protein
MTTRGRRGQPRRPRSLGYRFRHDPRWHNPTVTLSARRRHDDAGRRAPGILFGIGLGGLLDGIVLHQILQWHHMLTSEGDYPPTTVAGLETNTLWDGLFHAAAWITVVVALWLLWSRRDDRHPRIHGRAFLGWMLVGWGAFNLVEGLVNHQALGVHHVRDDLGGPLSWDLGFLGLGLASVAVGLLLARALASGPQSPD